MTRTRSRSIDIRMFIGVAIVIGAALVGYLLFTAAGTTTTMYVAKTVLLPGQSISEQDVSVAEVHLGSAESSYLATGALAPGMRVTETITAGALIPVSALTTKNQVASTHIVIELSSLLPQHTHTGSRVDLWSSMSVGQGVFAPPTVLVSDAQVAHISEPTGLGAASRGVEVEIVVPHSAVAAVLEAQANGDVLSLVSVQG